MRNTSITLLILLLITMLMMYMSTPYVAAEVIHSTILIPQSQLYSMISGERILIPYNQVVDAIIGGQNYTIDPNTSTLHLNNGYVDISFPQPRFMLIVDKIDYGSNSLKPLVNITVMFNKDPYLWSLIVSRINDKIVAYVQGRDSIGNDFLSEVVYIDENKSIQRLEVGYIPGTLYMYILSTNDNMIFYYPIPPKAIATNLRIEGNCKLQGSIYNLQLLSRGVEIVIPALEQQYIGGLTYYIIRSPSAFLALTPFNVKIEFIKPQIVSEVSYEKELISAIDLPYATGILRAALKPTLNGLIVKVNASFDDMVSLEELVDQLHYYIRRFAIKYDIVGYTVIDNKTIAYNLGTYILVLNDTVNTISIEVPKTFTEYVVNLTLISPGILYGNDLFSYVTEYIGTVILDDIINKNHIDFTTPFIAGGVDVRTGIACGVCGGTIKQIISKVTIDRIVNVDDFIDRAFPTLLHYYLITRVIVNNTEFSYEKIINDNHISYEFMVPLDGSYKVSFYIRAPGIVTNPSDLRGVREDKVADFTIMMITPKPDIVIDMPSIVNVIADKIPGSAAITIPVKVYWTPMEQVFLRTPTLYKVYLIKDNTKELVYSVSSMWLTDTVLNVEVPVTSNSHEILVEVDYFLGNQWYKVTKNILLNVTVKPVVTKPTTTPIIVYNVSPTTITVTETYTKTIPLTTIYVPVPNTTITKVLTLTTTLITSVVKTVAKNNTITITSTVNITNTTTVTKTITAILTRTITKIPELPTVLVSPPYSYGVVAIVAIVVVAISIKYFSRLYRKR